MKKFLKILMPVMLMTSLICGTVFAEPIPLRGVVEGFYGKPWTFADREELMTFCRQHNLNAYIYAPKDDPYHREKWREPYPEDKITQLKSLVDSAKANGVRFIFAVSPGLDLNYTDQKGDRDFKQLMRKLEAMYRIGVRNFAIFFDDLKDDKGRHREDGKLQAQFINRVQAELMKNHKDIGTILTVPTEYYREDMVNSNGKVKNYTRDFAANLDKRIVVLYTGDGVVCDGISEESLADVNKIYNRQIGIWWNYPVNDYQMTDEGERNAKLALGAIEKLPKADIQAIFFNPMSQPLLSRIALATGATYANNPATYDAAKSWDEALKEQFGRLAADMKIFADHSQHMENSWAKVGKVDGKDFDTIAYLAIYNFKAGKFFDYARIETEIDKMENAADTLLNKLPENILAECKPQLEQFKRIAQADRLAAQCLKNKKIDPRLKTLRAEIKSYENTAILSEQSGIKFIDDVINLLK